MKIADVKTGVRYLVIPTWYSATADAKNPDKVTDRHGVGFVTLTSLDRYKAQTGTWYNSSIDSAQLAQMFPKADKSDKNWGYLVQDESTKRWYVLKPANIVGEAQPICERWDNEKAQEQAEAEKRERELQERKLIAQQLKTEAEANLAGMVKTLHMVIGSRFDVNKVENNFWRLENHHDSIPNITLPLEYILILQERYLEMKDQVDSY